MKKIPVKKELGNTFLESVIFHLTKKRIRYKQNPKERTRLIDFATSQMVKHLPTIRETRIWSLGREDPLEKEMEIYSSTLAWKIPWMEEPVRLQSMGLQRVRHNWATSLITHEILGKMRPFHAQINSLYHSSSNNILWESKTAHKKLKPWGLAWCNPCPLWQGLQQLRTQCPWLSSRKVTWWNH